MKPSALFAHAYVGPTDREIGELLDLLAGPTTTTEETTTEEPASQETSV